MSEIRSLGRPRQLRPVPEEIDVSVYSSEGFHDDFGVRVSKPSSLVVGGGETDFLATSVVSSVACFGDGF